MERHGTHRDLDTSNLRLLERMDDFKVAKGDPDVRGWEVIGKDGKRIGTVDHLIVDPAARQVRYLGVDVERNLRPSADRDHVLVPVESARLSDERRDRVFIPQSSAEIASLAVYDERSIQRAFGDRTTTGATTGATARGTTTPRTGREEERMTLAEEELAIGKRKASAGEVDVRKRVEKEHVHETVPVKHEEARVEHRPPSGQTAPSFRDEEIRIPLTREEVVVEKRAVPKEDIVVKKHEVTGKERVDETVRKEHADVREKGDVRHTDRDRRH